MTTGDHDQRDDGRRAPEEESLNQALNDLEEMLNRRQGADDGTAPPAADEPAEGQYSIPLLNDVVVPGRESAAIPLTASRARPAAEAAQTALLDRELTRHVVERLASEIEVIVQARVEQALRTATEEIRREVRNHIEIMLPEILDEIADERPTGDTPAGDDEDRA